MDAAVGAKVGGGGDSLKPRSGRWLSFFLRPRVLRIVLALYALLAVLFPRFVPVIAMVGLAVILLGAYPLRWYLDGEPPRWIALGYVTSATLGLIAMFVIACLWSAEPSTGLTVTGTLAVLLVSALAIATLVSWLEPRQLRAMAEGLVIGMLGAAFYVAIETMSGREIERQLHTWFPILRENFGRHYPVTPEGTVKWVSHTAFNRSTCAFTILLFPTLAAAHLMFEGWRRIGATAILVAAAASVLTESTHQSSQLALIAGVLVLLLAFASSRVARRVVAALFVAAFVAAVPISLWADRADLEIDNRIPYSMRARLIYWSYTAERILERPLFGVGTAATAALDAARIGKMEQPPGYAVPRRTAVHPHNVYLQIWYEVGAFGVVVAIAFGLALLRRTSGLSRRVQPYAVATAAVGTAILMPSYGLWQAWFQALLGAACLAVWAVSHAISTPLDDRTGSEGATALSRATHQNEGFERQVV